MSEQIFKCCFCGQEFKGWGNNPEPLNHDENARCCDECDGALVIPARIYLLTKSRSKES